MRLEPTEGGGYIVRWGVNAVLGELCKLEDGYFHFFPSRRGGCYSAFSLSLIVHELHKLNYEWDQEVKKLEQT